ncbi:hypothetical protein H4582DRAFT_25658 [Lactarius indigo]|nr:hypothetical protein H4582DRAFT_25658 [Lactarius indigo]
MWFRLAISLNCAHSATLIQQWARDYRELMQPRGTPHKSGRIRAFIFDGLTSRLGTLARAVTPITKLLHISSLPLFRRSRRVPFPNLVRDSRVHHVAFIPAFRPRNPFWPTEVLRVGFADLRRPYGVGHGKLWGLLVLPSGGRCSIIRSRCIADGFGMVCK